MLTLVTRSGINGVLPFELDTAYRLEGDTIAEYCRVSVRNRLAERAFNQGANPFLRLLLRLEFCFNNEGQWVKFPNAAIGTLYAQDLRLESSYFSGFEALWEVLSAEVANKEKRKWIRVTPIETNRNSHLSFKIVESSDKEGNKHLNLIDVAMVNFTKGVSVACRNHSPNGTVVKPA